jgi:hypothetical protein
MRAGHEAMNKTLRWRALSFLCRSVLRVGLRFGPRGVVRAIDLCYWLAPRFDRVLRGIVMVCGVVVILGRHLGHLLLALGAAALITPLLLWPPFWPMIISAFDAARRDDDLRRDDDD